jgi:hypothetical protein
MLSAIAGSQADLEVQLEAKDQPSSSAAEHGSDRLSKPLQDVPAHVVNPDASDSTPAASDPWDAYIVHGPADLEAHGQAVLQQATLKRYTYKVEIVHQHLHLQSRVCTCQVLFADRSGTHLVLHTV